MLILASKSPRRAQLLKEAGYTFIQLESPFTDPPEPDPSSRGLQGACDLAIKLATQKAHALAKSPSLPPNSVILAADTICVDDQGQLIGTPQTQARAREIILAFTNKTHHVVTGCSILSPDGQETTFADSAAVHVGHISDSQLAEYLATNQWQGKAGGYNLSQRVMAGWPITVQGDHDTVTGLPIQKLLAPLARHSIHPSPSPD
jgi:septum formation protein